MTEALDLGKLTEEAAEWLFELSDRTSPEEYPDMGLVTAAEVAGFAADYNHRLLSRLREVEDWQPIETAPRDGTLVDIWSGGRYADMFWCAAHGAWGRKEVRSRHLITSVKVGLEPTHWMPLPEPPARAALSNSPLGEGLGSSVAGLPSSQSGSDTDLIAKLEAAAMVHLKLSNAPKSPQWQCKAHAHAWAGMMEAIALTKAAAILSMPGSASSPIAWRVKDYADGWITFATGAEALAEVAAMGGAMIEPVPPGALKS